MRNQPHMTLYLDQSGLDMVDVDLTIQMVKGIYAYRKTKLGSPQYLLCGVGK